MKRYKYLVVLFLLCASLLTACGTGKSQSSNQGSGVDAGNSATSQGEAGTGNIVTSLPAGETDGVQGSNMTSCVETLYNPQSSSLALTDLAAKTILASYPFDANQCVLSTEKVQNGVVALVTAQTEDDANSGNQSGVLIQSVDSDEKITVYRFDQQLNLRYSFRLDYSSLPDELVSSPLAVSRDGNTLTWVQEDGIYQYALETGDLKQVPLKLPETVYFVQIRYSEDGKSLFYFGDSGQEKVTAYGVLDVETGEGTLFHAKDFDASNITVTGGYAVVNASVPPGASSGNGHVLFIDSIKKAGNEITLRSQDENGLATVTEDGKVLVTCSETDRKCGTLRFYDTANSELESEQPYSCEQEGMSHHEAAAGHRAGDVERPQAAGAGRADSGA